jgi:lysophospholipid acyltransferase (LPLAT)-like uncharacterized protein
VPLFKRLARSETARTTLCWIAAQYMRVLYLTGRWRIEGGDIPGRFWDENRPFILAFWHGRLLMMPFCWRRDRRMHMLTSQHRDGELIARTIAHFDIGTVRGSSNRGGAAALRGMVKALRRNEYVGVTPDGPHGPRMRATDGVVTVARLAGVPIIPATYSATRRRVLRSWDRFILPMPFARGVILWGEPLQVPADADEAGLEAFRLRLEDTLTALSDEADRRCGQPAIPPDVAPSQGAA